MMNCCLMTAGKYACREGHAAAAGEGADFRLLAQSLLRLGDDARRQPGRQEMTMRHPAGMKKSASHPREEVTAAHAYRQDQALHKGKTYAIILSVPCDGREMERCPSGRRCLTRNQVWRITTVGSNPTLSASESKSPAADGCGAFFRLRLPLLVRGPHTHEEKGFRSFAQNQSLFPRRRRQPQADG